MSSVIPRLRLSAFWASLALLAALSIGSAGCGQPGQPAGAAAPPDAPGLQVPSSVQTEAFSYWGLNNPRPIVYDLRLPERNGEGGEEVATRSEQGVATIQLKEVGDDVATFVVQRSGGLSIIGDDTVEARPDGIFVVSTSLGTISEPIMELPAVIEPGKTWSSQVKLEMDDGTSIVQSFEYRIAGTESLTVQLGTFEALRVAQDATLQTTGPDGVTTTSRVSGSIWYVRDVGIVKVESTIEPETGPPMNVAYEAVRYAEGEQG